jgi:hypothetical protein
VELGVRACASALAAVLYEEQEEQSRLYLAAQPMHRQVASRTVQGRSLILPLVQDGPADDDDEAGGSGAAAASAEVEAPEARDTLSDVESDEAEEDKECVLPQATGCSSLVSCSCWFITHLYSDCITLGLT